MEYGRVTPHDLETADTSLPQDGQGNEAMLGGKPANTKFYMGTPRWGRQEWVGQLYPKGTRDFQFCPKVIDAISHDSGLSTREN